MISNEITLTPEDILEKEFKLDTRGYRPQEVDKFLDIIIKDYHAFIVKIKKNEMIKIKYITTVNTFRVRLYRFSGKSGRKTDP